MAEGGAIARSGYKPGSSQNRALAATGKTKEQIAQEVIQRYLDGQDTSVQARELGVSKQRLNQILLDVAADEWKSAQAAVAWTEYEQAKYALESAPDALDLARRREQLKAAQWELERLNRRLFGQDQPPAAAQVAISINLGGPSIKTIEPDAAHEIGNSTQTADK